MAHRALPLLLLNLGGEMVYILEQRLQAQSVSPDKATKVLVDICRLLLHERFVEELLQPQPLGHASALRSFFRDLAHASIMRLDEESMAKMWDLMTMAVKQQALRADSPRELLDATLNHVDYIGEHVPEVLPQAELARQALVKLYSRMPSGELQAVRYSVLNYLQGLAVRVSLYLRTGLQDMHGRILLPRDGPVPPGCEPPGTIRVLDGAGREVDDVLLVVRFPAGGQFAGPRDDQSGTELGCNLYCEGEDAAARAAVRGSSRWRRGAAPYSSSASSSTTAEVGDDQHGRALRVGREELNMLMAQLLGNRPSPSSQAGDASNRLINVTLFSSGDAEAQPSDHFASGSTPNPRSNKTVSIDASGSAGSRSANLRQVLSDLDDGLADDPDDDDDNKGEGENLGGGGVGSVPGHPKAAVNPTLLDLWEEMDEHLIACDWDGAPN